ncbi:hypothetical protein GYM41_000756 [Escherichia coli]|nr:hypothetical protein [Escherichia coli]EGO6620756.1 hypothetical protein [Escherichia coli]
MKESESEVSWSSQKSKRKQYFTRYSAATMAGKDAWQALFLAICMCQKWGCCFLIIIFITLKGYLCDSHHIKIDFCDGCHIISAKTITPA